MDWKKMLLAAGGVASAAAVLYLLLREEPEGANQFLEAAEKRVSGGEITKEQLKQILQEIIASQDKMKGFMKKLSQEWIKEKPSFEQTYEKVKGAQPDDPLERHGLSMPAFDELLQKHQNDPTIHEAIAKIMGAPSADISASEQVKAINVQKIIDVHKFMSAELEALCSEIQGLPGRASLDPKVVTITAQAIVGAKIEQDFGFSSEDIEGAVMMNHTSLAAHQEFAMINMSIQQAMAKLMGQ